LRLSFRSAYSSMIRYLTKRQTQSPGRISAAESVSELLNLTELGRDWTERSAISAPIWSSLLPFAVQAVAAPTTIEGRKVQSPRTFTVDIRAINDATMPTASRSNQRRAGLSRAVPATIWRRSILRQSPATFATGLLSPSSDASAADGASVRTSSPAGGGFAPYPHQPDQRQLIQRRERMIIPARSEQVRTQARRGRLPRSRTKENGHEIPKRIPPQSVTAVKPPE
jgi:hypothetical protein